MKRNDGSPDRCDDPDRVADAIIARVGKNLVLALPLGLGKASHVANALFARASADPSIRLHIFTALTLETPRSRPGLERRFVQPFAERVFAGYPELAYAKALHAGTLPPNIIVDEFFFHAGTRLGIAAVLILELNVLIVTVVVHRHLLYWPVLTAWMAIARASPRRPLRRRRDGGCRCAVLRSDG